MRETNTVNVIVTDLVVTRGSPADRAGGLLAYLRFTVGGIRVSGVTLRRTSAGALRLSWPAKLDARGIERVFVQPANTARAAIESAVLRAVAATLNGAAT